MPGHEQKDKPQMISIRRMLTIGALLGLASLIVAPSLAQRSTITVTEAEINASYRINNPARLSVTSKSVDLQPGQVYLTTSWQTRQGGRYTSYVTLVPVIEAGNLNWRATSARVEGLTGRGQQVLIDAVTSGWQATTRELVLRYDVDGITISDSEMTLNVYATGESRTLPGTVDPNARTLTITEAEINAAQWLTTSRAVRLSDARVDLQAGQAVITATYTSRQGSSGPVVAVFVPALEEGSVIWTLVSASYDGQPASGDALMQINYAMANSWARYLKQQHGRQRVTGVEISEDAIIYSF